MAGALLPILLLLRAAGAAANVTYCWGLGSSGQLGDGQGGGAHTQAVPTPLADAPEFAAVRAGAMHTCGLTAAGEAYCWVGGWDAVRALPLWRCCPALLAG